MTKRNIKIVSDSFAICDDDEVIGVVAKCNETQWAVVTVVSCKPFAPARNIPLEYALEAAIRLERI